MKDLVNLLENVDCGKIKFELDGQDLLRFSQDLINRSKNELSMVKVDGRKEEYLSKQEVIEMLRVCSATLWHWQRKNYLVPFKIGNKLRYRLSDIQQILGEREVK